MTANGLMLDTTVFNHLLKGYFDRASLPPGRIYATAVQWTEIISTPDPEQRALLIGMFIEPEPTLIHPSTPVWYRGPTIGGHYDSMIARLAELDRKGKSRKARRDGGRADVLIGETAVLRKLVLVTGDGNLDQVVQEHGGQTFLTPDPRRKTKGAPVV